MIRAARLTDCSKLAALSIQTWLNTYARDGINQAGACFVLNTFTPTYFKKKLAQKNYHIYVFEEDNSLHDGCLVGFCAIDLESKCSVTGSGFEIDTLYVQDRHQGKGIGRMLLAHIGALHGTDYWLTTWVNNVDAISFYQHLGFKDIGTRYFELDNVQHENRLLSHKHAADSLTKAAH